MSRHTRRAMALSGLLCLLAAGCAGYHLGAPQPHFMAGIHSIAVPTFKNATLIPRIETLVTNTVIRQMQQDGTYKVASSADDADAVMEGEIVLVRRKAARTVQGDVQATREFDMTLSLHTRIISRASGQAIDDRRTNGSTSFFVSGDVNQDELQAIPLAAQDAAVRMVASISEGW